MHVYIYDDFLIGRKHENLLASIETRLTDLGLNGKIIRLGNMKSTLSLLENELRQAPKTIIAVGNDSTVNKVLNKIVSYQTNEDSELTVPLGIIPIGRKNNSISTCLGILNEEDACDVLAARRIEKIDVGQIEPVQPNQQINKKYFISHISIPESNTKIEIDKKYSVELMNGGEINVINLPTLNISKEGGVSPKDGKLELVIDGHGEQKLIFSKQADQSIFSFSKITIINPQKQLNIDNSFQINAPVEVSTLKNKLNIIVGKERCF